MDRTSNSSPYYPYRRTLLTPEIVRELSVLRPWRSVLAAARCWALIALAWTAVAIRTEVWVVLLAIPIIGTQYYALFILAHDGIHQRLFDREVWNNLFADLFLFGPIGGITRLNSRNHLMHHRHLATSNDPDRHRHGCFNKSDRREYAGFLTGVTSVYQSIANVFLRHRGRAVVVEAGTAALHYTARDLAIILGWQIALVGGLSWQIGWWAYPVLWALPVYCFAVLGDNARSFAEHSHPEADLKADQHRLITFDSNRVERMFFAPLNMNYHTVHHFWPSIPYYNLPRADREIRARPETQGLEWRRSYVGYLWRYFRALPLVECKSTRPAPDPSTV